jgi:hypothetical protein
METDAKSSFSLYGFEKTVVQSTKTSFRYLKGNLPESGVPLRLEIVEQQMFSDGIPVQETETGQAVEMLLQNNGKVLKSSNIRILENFQDMIVSLPTEAINVGHRWINEIPMQLPDGKGNMVTTKAKLGCELQAIKPFKGVNCAWITMKMLIKPDATSGTRMQAVTKGKIFLDIKTGTILGMKTDLSLKLEVQKQEETSDVMFTTLELKMVNKLNRMRE